MTNTRRSFLAGLLALPLFGRLTRAQAPLPAPAPRRNLLFELSRYVLAWEAAHDGHRPRAIICTAAFRQAYYETCIWERRYINTILLDTPIMGSRSALEFDRILVVAVHGDHVAWLGGAEYRGLET